MPMNQQQKGRGMAQRRHTGRLPRQRRRRVFGGLINDASGVLQSVANDVAPGVVDAIDVNAVVQRVDIQEVVERVDMNAVLAEVNMNALLAGVNLNAPVDQVDVEKVVDKLDINAILAQVDIDALIEHTDMGSIIGAAGAGMASKAVDVARSEGVSLDFLLQRWSDRLRRRRPSAQPGGPALLVREPGPVSP